MIYCASPLINHLLILHFGWKAIEHKKWSGFRRSNPRIKLRVLSPYTLECSLWFTARCCQYEECIAPNGRQVGEWQSGKDLAGSSRSPSKVLTRNCLKGRRKTCQNNRRPVQDSILVSPEYKSRELPLHQTARYTTVWIWRNMEDTSTRRTAETWKTLLHDESKMLEKSAWHVVRLLLETRHIKGLPIDPVSTYIVYLPSNTNLYTVTIRYIKYRGAISYIILTLMSQSGYNTYIARTYLYIVTWRLKAAIVEREPGVHC
jgi:hypothetical protein